MAIIVVLAAVAIPTFGRQLETSRETADMEVIRSAYTEALALAVLDGSDGVINGKNGNATTFPTSAGNTTPIHYTAGENGAAGTYTVTFANMVPAAAISQTGDGWQFVNSTLGGQTVPNALSSSKKAITVTFDFELDTNGNVALKSTDGIKFAYAT